MNILFRLAPKRLNIFRINRFLYLIFILLSISTALSVVAGPREQAKRIHDRLAGIPPTAAVLDAMATNIAAGNPQAAADLAMTNSAFYNITLKNFITPWTNEAQTVFAPLNDYTATIIGMIRDEVPFNQVLSADMVYIAASGAVATAYSHTDNQHYIELENNRVDLSDPTQLIQTTQSGLAGTQLAAADTAGIITTRAAGEAFFIAGTNRSMWRFIGINYLCRDLEEMNDVTRTPDRVQQDVTRSPGGDSSIFLNSCVGCHSGMDPLAQAFAYYEFDETAGRVVYTAGQVQPKYLINSNAFNSGYITQNDRWDNYWRSGPNAVLGWRGSIAGGNGAKSLGTEVTASRAFSQCQVKKVFEQVCFRSPGSAADFTEVDRITDLFEAQNYNLKRVFAESAAFCMGS